MVGDSGSPLITILHLYVDCIAFQQTSIPHHVYLFVNLKIPKESTLNYIRL